MPTKEFFITKLTFRDTERLIKDVCIYEFDGQNLSEGETQDRNWLVNKVNNGSQISAISPNPEKHKNWIRNNKFKYENGIFSWGLSLPLNSTKHKTFLSYYHNDDQIYKEKFKNIFGDLIINKSVENGDIDSDNSDEYVKQLIQKGYLADTTLLIVLLGLKTKCRMHIDWEISGALNLKVGDKYSGLLGIKLPSHPDYGKAVCNPSNLPPRLSDNLKSGYAIIRDWTDNRVLMQSYINEAFTNRNGKSEQRVNSRTQMDKDTCV
jgi:hypothetical protein